MRLSLGVVVIRSRQAEVLAIQGKDPERKLIGLESFSALGGTHERMQRLAQLIRLECAQSIVQGRIGNAAPHSEQSS